MSEPLSTSFRAFEVLEILRYKAQLSQREVCKIAGIIESVYSRMKSRSREGGEHISGALDIKIQVAIVILVEVLQEGILPDIEGLAPNISILMQSRSLALLDDVSHLEDRLGLHPHMLMEDLYAAAKAFSVQIKQNRI